jgi:hypothetical protein
MLDAIDPAADSTAVQILILEEIIRSCQDRIDRLRRRGAKLADIAILAARRDRCQRAAAEMRGER